MSIDPIRLAQFMVLPGAAELVDAFSAIRPGPLRDSIVHHARMIAEEGGWNPPPITAHPEPPRLAAPARLASPYAKGLAAASAEGQIVERALRGEAPHVIADDLGVKLGLVVRLMAKARKEGGLVFPGDDEAGAKPAKRGMSRKGLPTMPVPPPPYWWEDPESPVWENPGLLPNLSENSDGSMAGLGPHDRRTYATMTLAAGKRGLTLRQYFAHRLNLVQCIEAGESPVALAMRLRIQTQEVYNVVRKVGRGRMESLNARPLPAAEKAPETAVEARPPRVAPTTPANREASALKARQAAALKWGFDDVEAYEHARLRVRHLRMQGVAPALIGQRIGRPYKFVMAAMTHWRELGVDWPPININAVAQETEAA